MSYLCFMKHLCYSSTPLSSIGDDELIHIVSHMFEFCEKHLGVNNRYKTFPLVQFSDINEKGNYAEYDPYKNVIRIFKTIKTLGQFTSTFIHEYTHYLQPCKTKYSKLMKEHGYEFHPFESEARMNEYLYNRKLLSYLRKNA